MTYGLKEFAAAMPGETTLDRAALLIGRIDDLGAADGSNETAVPNVALAPYLAQLDALAASVQQIIDHAEPAAGPRHGANERTLGAGPIQRAKAICTVLFDDAGFRGNEADYYDPRNSFLSCVLDRKLGIPITLGILYLEVARRVGVLAQGVNFPGQFIVRVAVEDAWMFVDVFNRGKILAPSELEGLVKKFVGPDAKLEPRLVAAASKRQILTRLLTNLAGIYGKSGDLERSMAVLEHMAIVDPDNNRLSRELASLRDRINTLN
ncbi:MAG: transglutaminase family protein [Kofleriaceae bacterium]|nr:transglutaminase family protein [Kofleriaceae bacterium]